MKQNSIPIPQLGAATALVQLLSENPGLPAAMWTVGEHALHGHLHAGGFGALGRYAGVLGGSIRPLGADYPCGGRVVRTHRLVAMWRDIPVHVDVVLPVPRESAVEFSRRVFGPGAPVEDPHDSPLHHSYALGRDLPEVSA